MNDTEREGVVVGRWIAVVGVLAASLAAAAGAWAVRASRVVPGRYAWEAGPHTFDDAVSFRVVRAGGRVTLRKLLFRNRCLTQNDPRPPRIPVRRDGSFDFTYRSPTLGRPKVHLSGRFTGARRANGHLSIGYPGCQTDAAFTARHA